VVIVSLLQTLAIVSEMIYNISSGTLNPLYCWPLLWGWGGGYE